MTTQFGVATGVGLQPRIDRLKKGKKKRTVKMPKSQWRPASYTNQSIVAPPTGRGTQASIRSNSYGMGVSRGGYCEPSQQGWVDVYQQQLQQRN